MGGGRSASPKAECKHLFSHVTLLVFKRRLVMWYSGMQKSFPSLPFPFLSFSFLWSNPATHHRWTSFPSFPPFPPFPSFLPSFLPSWTLLLKTRSKKNSQNTEKKNPKKNKPPMYIDIIYINDDLICIHNQNNIVIMGSIDGIYESYY